MSEYNWRISRLENYQVYPMHTSRREAIHMTHSDVCNRASCLKSTGHLNCKNNTHTTVNIWPKTTKTTQTLNIWKRKYLANVWNGHGQNVNTNLNHSKLQKTMKLHKHTNVNPSKLQKKNYETTLILLIVHCLLAFVDHLSGECLKWTWTKRKYKFESQKTAKKYETT
jgi:hypothetical protein